MRVFRVNDEKIAVHLQQRLSVRLAYGSCSVDAISLLIAKQIQNWVLNLRKTS